MLKYILKDIMLPISYLPSTVVVAICFVAIYVLFNVIFKKKVLISHYVLLLIFATYMAVILFQTFISREPGSRNGIDLSFMGTWGTTMRAHAYVVENIIMMIPLGILIPFTWKRMRKYPWCVIMACILSIIIETVQLITQRGYCQLDDVIMNSLGALLGFILWKVIFEWQVTFIEVRCN